MSETKISFQKPATEPPPPSPRRQEAPAAQLAVNTTPTPSSTAIVPTSPAAGATLEVRQSGEVVSIGFDTEPGFEALQRLGKMFAQSALVPEIYRGNIANCSIAVEMALRMRMNPIMVMQNLYMVHGNPSWASKFLIASFNQTGRFSSIRYRWVGQPGSKERGCVAWAKEKSTGEVVESPLVDWKMVEAEGWSSKKGSKWLTMPDLMFMYRAAAFLVRTTAPELTMGLQTAEESRDLVDLDDRPPAREILGGVAALRAFAIEESDGSGPGRQPE